ncbi:hypothetical protein J437_LFUL014412 [Ladona fulva]|uniref:Uncharacterized protein n=1 Tax=Ladona fulva TaxID=123851 RepID=A0A8K0K5P1_LADFU|nr:hypothetical protein J437_LFUL014412 [Ladona fulva]
MLKEQMSLLQFFLNFLAEDFPESLKIYMKNMEGIINEFLLDSDCKTSNDTGYHFPEFIKEKSVKDAENNELSRKSGYKIFDGFKRKASLTRKMILHSRRSSESQAGNSQWYIPSPSSSNMPSISTLPSMNFSDETGRDSLFYVQASYAGSQKSLSYKSLQNLRDASMDIHENLIIKSKVDETVSLPGHIHSYEKLPFAVYTSKTSLETDRLSFMSAVSHMTFPFPSNSTDESQHFAIVSAARNEMVNATPPPLPSKLLENKSQTSGNLINEEDKSSYESTKSSTEALSILSHESGKLCLDKQENEMENNISPPVPPRKKRLHKK